MNLGFNIYTYILHIVSILYNFGFHLFIVSRFYHVLILSAMA